MAVTRGSPAFRVLAAVAAVDAAMPQAGDAERWEAWRRLLGPGDLGDPLARWLWERRDRIEWEDQAVRAAERALDLPRRPWVWGQDPAEDRAFREAAERAAREAGLPPLAG